MNAQVQISHTFAVSYFLLQKILESVRDLVYIEETSPYCIINECMNRVIE